jgi:hypothetical protein
VVFSGYSVSSTNKTYHHDITESGVKHYNPNKYYLCLPYRTLIISSRNIIHGVIKALTLSDKFVRQVLLSFFCSKLQKYFL